MTETTDQKKSLQEQQTLEEAFGKLEELAQKLEDSSTSLEDSFRFYKKGMELLKYCSSRLDTVEKKMLQMDEDGTLREF
nr:exodeoxyribonuclease VII small subunit [uncultured Blautia sp.]